MLKLIFYRYKGLKNLMNDIIIFILIIDDYGLYLTGSLIENDHYKGTKYI